MLRKLRVECTSAYLNAAFRLFYVRSIGYWEIWERFSPVCTEWAMRFYSAQRSRPSRSANIISWFRRNHLWIEEYSEESDICVRMYLSQRWPTTHKIQEKIPLKCHRNTTLPKHQMKERWRTNKDTTNATYRITDAQRSTTIAEPPVNGQSVNNWGIKPVLLARSLMQNYCYIKSWFIMHETIRISNVDQLLYFAVHFHVHFLLGVSLLKITCNTQTNYFAINRRNETYY